MPPYLTVTTMNQEKSSVWPARLARKAARAAFRDDNPSRPTTRAAGPSQARTRPASNTPTSGSSCGKDSSVNRA